MRAHNLCDLRKEGKRVSREKGKEGKEGKELSHKKVEDVAS